MQYLLLIYDDESVWASMSEEQTQEIMGAYFDYSEKVFGAGVAKAGDASGTMLREANLPRHLHQPTDAKDQDGNPDGASPDADTSEIVPPDVKEGEVGHDPQLDKALELLRNGQVQKTTIAQRSE